MTIQCLRSGFDRFRGAVQSAMHYWDRNPRLVQATLAVASSLFAHQVLGQTFIGSTIAVLSGEVALYEGVSYLRERISPRYADRGFVDRFVEAVEKRNKELASYFWEKISPSRKNRLLVTAITEREDTEVAKALMDRFSLDGIDRVSLEQLSSQYKRGETPLHVMIRETQTEIARALIEKLEPEQLSLQDEWGETPLHAAIGCYASEIAECLIEKLSPDQLCIQDSRGRTPLHDAVYQPQLRIVKALIPQLPQSAFLKSDGLQTPLELAEQLERDWPPEELTRNGPKIANLIRTAMGRGQRGVAG